MLEKLYRESLSSLFCGNADYKIRQWLPRERRDIARLTSSTFTNQGLRIGHPLESHKWHTVQSTNTMNVFIGPVVSPPPPFTLPNLDSYTFRDFTINPKCGVNCW